MTALRLPEKGSFSLVLMDHSFTTKKTLPAKSRGPDLTSLHPLIIQRPGAVWRALSPLAETKKDPDRGTCKEAWSQPGEYSFSFVAALFESKVGD